MDWDSEAKTIEEFPKDQYEWIEVNDPDQARAIVAYRAFTGDGSPIFGQTRWFGPGKGVILIPRQSNDIPKVSIPDPDPLTVYVWAFLSISFISWSLWKLYKHHHGL